MKSKFSVVTGTKSSGTGPTSSVVVTIVDGTLPTAVTTGNIAEATGSNYENLNATTKHATRLTDPATLPTAPAAQLIEKSLNDSHMVTKQSKPRSKYVGRGPDEPRDLLTTTSTNPLLK